jgi:NAD+ kinase
MKIGITANPNRPAALVLARRAVDRIGDRAEVVVSPSVAKTVPERPHAELERLSADVLVAIGGDGTFLYAMKRSEVPLLPINAGTVGVLAEVDARRPREFEGALDQLLGGHYSLEERMKLAGGIGPEALPDALNEYVVHAGHVGRMGLFEVAFDGRPVGRIRADGLIVATPTGSTGYSLSSLGPIVDPTVEALVLTAIAPFRAQARAVVIDPLRTVTLRALEAAGGAVVIADGEDERPLAEGAAVVIHRSPRRGTLVRFGRPSFERLRGKRILPWTEDSEEEGADADLPPPS